PQALLAELAALDPELLRCYPDATAVETALADRVGVSPDRVLVTAGADEALDRIYRAYAGPDRPVLLPEPTFDMLERFADLAGAPLVRVPWIADAFPLEEILAELDNRIAIVVIVSPNNPTGGVASRDDVRRIAAAAPRALLLLDQAYVEPADFERLTRALETVLTPEAIVFDLDGVLADVRESQRAAMIATAASFGVTVTMDDIEAALRAGDASNDWIVTQRLIAAGGGAVDLPSVTTRYQALYLGANGSPGLRDRERSIVSRDVLARLSNRLPLAVVTGR